MRFQDIDVRARTIDGDRTVELDGYHRVHPESKPGEYRRVALADLLEEQTRELSRRLTAIVTEWDEGD